MEQLTVSEPLLDLRTFKYSIFRMSTLIMIIVMMAMFSAMLLLPIFFAERAGLQSVEGRSGYAARRYCHGDDVADYGPVI